MAFSLYDLYGHALAQKPLPGGHAINILGRPFLCHPYLILSLSGLCLGVEIFTEKMHFYCIYSHTLGHEHLPRGHEIYNLSRLFLGHHCYALS